MRASLLVTGVALAMAVAPVVARATVLYSDNFNTAASAANYNVFSTTSTDGVPTGVATFAFDYSALGIPAAPNSLGDGATVGLRVQSDQVANSDASFILGAISVVTKGLTLPSQYKVQVSVWGNYLGGASIADANGTNGTTGPTIGIGSAGTTFQDALTNSNDGVLFDTIRDPTGSGGTYRVYYNGTNQGNSNNNFSIYAASGGDNGATTAQRFDNAYYATLFPSVSAPTAQSSAASTQTGSTPAGTFGFAWHSETITQDGTNITWAIDGTTMATIPDSQINAFGGSQIGLGDQDSNTGANTTTNGQLYNFNVFDDLVVSDLSVPEPATLGLLGLIGLGALGRRRRGA